MTVAGLLACYAAGAVALGLCAVGFTACAYWLDRRELRKACRIPQDWRNLRPER